jgi:alanyl-tRNA synthetase
MLTKKDLIKEFQKRPEEYWSVEIFKERGFTRRQCVNCGKFFWSVAERKLCADPPCQKYEFIHNTITKVKWNYIETWKNFERFFVKNGHTSVPRYPVIDRWRPDLFFTMCSIQDFQRLDNGKMTFEYPANPLVVPQVSLRFNDIPNVGVTGRHHTSFIMPGQHAFNDDTGRGYWKDRTIELNYKWFTGEMGIPEEELIYIEDLWAMPDFSAFGPCMETFSKGLELVNSVFMQFTASNGSYKELPLKVIDVGWGHERLVWFSNGTSTGYEAVFDEVGEKMFKKVGLKIDKDLFDRYAMIAGGLNLDEVSDAGRAWQNIAGMLKVDESELKKTVEPVQAMYAIADHAKTLLFAIVDGGIPSNVGGGYNLRLVLRRALNFIDQFNFDLDLAEVAEWHAKFLKPMFPELMKGIENVYKILDIEKKRYKETLERSRKTVTNLLQKKIEFDYPTLKRLYESDGVTPELIETIAKKENLRLTIPGDFYTRLSNERSRGVKEVEKVGAGTGLDISGIQPTKALYYDKPYEKEFTANILKTVNGWVVLDQTLFYPEGGGQPSDVGELDGVKVTEVRKIKDVILHRVDGKIESKTVKGKIDWNRRFQLMQMHSATHIVAGAARKVLGPHIWQHGAQKGLEKSRIDLTHYDKLTEEEIEKIENLANEIVQSNIKINIKVMSRNEAEQKYGFTLYQGGASPGKLIRVVKIGEFDVEACGGTHCRSTGEIGFIDILGSKRIQDGVIRLEFAVGDAAVKNLKEKEVILQEVAKKLDVKEDDVPEAVEKLFKTWKEKRKQLKRNK